MNYKMIGRYLSGILALEAAFMLPALGISLYDRTAHVTSAFLCTIAAILAVAGLLRLLCRRAEKGFYAKEGMVCVASCWIIMSILGCLPFFISREIPNYIDALFEIVSGFTTTGSSILVDVESMSRGLIYWRSFTHWLGGMGVLVFLLAFVSSKGRNTGFTLHLLRAESPGPIVGKLVPKMRQTAAVMYFLYSFLTIVNIIFLLVGKMPLFDALCTAFGTAGTGGFGIKADSMASYSPYLQNVCTVFMLLFGVNFSCYFLLLLRRFRPVLCDEELRLYVGMFLGSTVLIILNLRGYYSTFEETVRHAAFQVSSIMTTTGFATDNFDLWPSFSKTILLSLMIVGACAGSTAGGLKCVRLLLLLKTLRRNVLQALSPQKVQAVTLNREPISEKVLANVNSYLTAYFAIAVLSILLVSLDGFSIETNLSAVLSCFNNIGPGLDLVGPASNFSAYSMGSKLVLIFDMLAGRLEIFPLITFLSPGTWKNA